VWRLVMVEGALMGTLGAALGAALGLAPNSNVEFRIVPSVVAGAFTIGLVATVLASIPAALRASRLPIVDALHRLA
jgi:putative ABC transport system permease protein